MIMKKLIGVISNFGFGISCDGKNVEVFGSGDTAESIKKLINDPESSYSQFVKNGTMDDPVEYWITSAQNFEYETIPYSQENLDMMKAKFSE
jgi:hypothetical protein